MSHSKKFTLEKSTDRTNNLRQQRYKARKALKARRIPGCVGNPGKLHKDEEKVVRDELDRALESGKTPRISWILDLV
jgi:hypothetical protein